MATGGPANQIIVRSEGMERADGRTPTSSPLLAVRDIHVAYVKKEVLRGVSFTLRHGEVLTIVGGNGSGKSTLLKTIAGILSPTEGQLELNGDRLDTADIANRQRLGIGYLLQGGHVFPNLRVDENVAIAATHHRGGARSDVRAGTIFPALRTKNHIRAGLLSGGERQMLAMEMVLVQEPLLALLDEPTAALDPDAVTQVLDAVNEFAHRVGCGVLLVEQNVHEAKRVSDRQLRLVEGLVVPGDPDDRRQL